MAQYIAVFSSMLTEEKLCQFRTNCSAEMFDEITGVERVDILTVMDMHYVPPPNQRWGVYRISRPSNVSLLRLQGDLAPVEIFLLDHNFLPDIKEIYRIKVNLTGLSISGKTSAYELFIASYNEYAKKHGWKCLGKNLNSDEANRRAVIEADYEIIRRQAAIVLNQRKYRQ